MHLPPLDGEDVDTLGGYVTHLAGRVPHVGESFPAIDRPDIRSAGNGSEPRQTLAYQGAAPQRKCARRREILTRLTSSNHYENKPALALTTPIWYYSIIIIIA